MAARDQVGPSRQGRQDKEHGGDVRCAIMRIGCCTGLLTMNCSYLHSLPIKEYQIVDFFLPKLKDEVMKVRQLPYSGLRFLEICRPQVPI
jgi:hypothetical protein